MHFFNLKVSSTVKTKHDRGWAEIRNGQLVVQMVIYITMGFNLR
jgi:hypothetical protein